MCLQWCHVRSWLIDNDLSCTGCDRSEPDLLPAAWSCASCTHLIAHDGQARICGLTRETLPLAGRCCHWSAELTSSAALALSATELAPWLAEAGDAAEVFAASSSAPPISFGAAGQVIVAIDDLSVPLVYGVPAPDWDAALGWDMNTPAHNEVSADDVRLVAITTALEALEQGAPAVVRVRACLRIKIRIRAISSMHSYTKERTRLCILRLQARDRVVKAQL